MNGPHNVGSVIVSHFYREPKHSEDTAFMFAGTPRLELISSLPNTLKIKIKWDIEHQEIQLKTADVVALRDALNEWLFPQLAEDRR